MSNLQKRQDIIQEKRKLTPWKDFVMEICSWFPMNLYKNQGNISRFPNTARQPMLMEQILFAEGRNASLDKGGNIDGFFFEKLQVLFLNTNLPYTFSSAGSENSVYADGIAGAKNVYLSFGGAGMENVLYSLNTKATTNCIASVAIRDKSENIFECSGITKSFQCFYSHNLHDCRDIWFSSNLIGCSECIQCNDLVNQEYCINNVSYKKDEYLRKKKAILEDKATFIKRIPNTKVLSIKESSEYENTNYLYNVHKTHNCLLAGGRQDKVCMYDVFSGGAVGDFYGVVNAGGNSQYLYNFLHGGEDYMCFYSYFMEGCSYCLGCIGLANKSYCILNKQYTKEERYNEIDKIFGKIHEDGTLGDFFPATMNPFYFNDTAAYLIDPNFTKEEVTAKGYLRRDEPIKVDIPAGVQTVKVSELGEYEGLQIVTQTSRLGDKSPSHPPYQEGQSSVGAHGNAPERQRTINDEILKKVIIDDQGNAYRIIPMELEFLRKYELPLPRKHWLDRMKENFRIN